MLPRIDNCTKKPTNSRLDVVQIFPEFEYKLNFDGCSKGNPGLAGAGAVICHFEKECWADTFFVGEMFTNNHAEYAGLILGLHQAKIMGIKCLKVEGDSLLVINQMKGLYKCKSINLLDLYEKAKELETHFDKIDYEHVLRNKNKRADHLSNIAIDKFLNTKKRFAIYDDTESDDHSK
jgi:ribonuclease HI